jgi:hypothetical protein
MCIKMDVEIEVIGFRGDCRHSRPSSLSEGVNVTSRNNPPTNFKSSTRTRQEAEIRVVETRHGSLAPSLAKSSSANVHKTTLAFRDRVHRHSRATITTVSPNETGVHHRCLSGQRRTGRCAARRSACYMGIRTQSTTNGLLGEAASVQQPKTPTEADAGLHTVTSGKVPKLNIGNPKFSDANTLAAGRISLYPIRPGPTAYDQKLPGISVLGVLTTHDAVGMGVSI